jgi:ribosomal protein L11 methyltransferase
MSKLRDPASAKTTPPQRSIPPADRPRWLEASVPADEELAESVADVMARFAPGGVTLTYESIEPDPDGEGRPGGPLVVRAYLPWDADIPQRRTALEEALWHLGRIRTIPEPVFREVADADWTAEWKKKYRPLRIGRKIRIVPSWIGARPADGEVTLRLDPGMAFGTGMHPTTQLCLEALEDRVTRGIEIDDLGCGSGILAIGALKLGAARATGWDIDPEAVRSAGENARRNGVAGRFDVRLGTLDDLLRENRSAPVVAANILASVLREMLRNGLADAVAPDGCLILSGILLDQSEDVETALAEAGMRLAEKKTREDWAALVAEKP